MVGRDGRARAHGRRERPEAGRIAALDEVKLAGSAPARARITVRHPHQVTPQCRLQRGQIGGCRPLGQDVDQRPEQGRLCSRVAGAPDEVGVLGATARGKTAVGPALLGDRGPQRVVDVVRGVDEDEDPAGRAPGDRRRPVEGHTQVPEGLVAGVGVGRDEEVVAVVVDAMPGEDQQQRVVRTRAAQKGVDRRLDGAGAET